MKEGRGALHATDRTHHVGKDKERADREVICNSDPVDETLSVGNGSRDLEDPRKEERTSADERLEDRQLCTNAGAGASVEEDPELGSQPQEANVTTEEPSSELTCKIIPEESSDRTALGQGSPRTSCDGGSSESKEISVCGDFSSREKQERKLGKELVDQNCVLSDIEPGVALSKVEKPIRETEVDKCTATKDRNEQLDSISEDPVEKCDELLLELKSAETLMKSIKDQVFDTPNLEECKELLDRTEKEQSLDESHVLEGPKRTEEEEACRIEDCASASEAELKDDCTTEGEIVREAVQTEVSDVKPSECEELHDSSATGRENLSGASVLSEGLILDVNLECQDDTLGLILSVEKREDDTQPKSDDVPERRVPVEDEILAEEQAAKDIESLFDKDISKDNDFELDTEDVSNTEERGVGLGDSRGDSVTGNEEFEKDFPQHDKEDLLADEELSLESVSETSFSLNDNTEDDKEEIEVDMDGDSLKDSAVEDTQNSTAEKGTRSVEYKKDFLAELEDISSEDNEDFFAEMEASRLESSKDSVVAKEAFSLDSLTTREAAPMETDQDSPAEKEPFSLNKIEETSAEKKVISAGENEESSAKEETESNEDSTSENKEISLKEIKDSVSEKGGVSLGINEDIIAGVEAVSSDETEDSLAEVEALSMEIDEDYSAGSKLTGAAVLEDNGDSLSVNEAISLGSDEDFSAETEQVSLEDKNSGLAEMSTAPVEQLESRPLQTENVVEKEASQVEEAVSVECRVYASSADEELSRISEEEEQINVASESLLADEPKTEEESVLSQFLPINTETTHQCESPSNESPQDGVADSDRSMAIDVAPVLEETENEDSDALDQNSCLSSSDAKDNISVQADEQPIESAPLVASKDGAEGTKSGYDAFISDTTNSPTVDGRDVEVYDGKQSTNIALLSELENSVEPLLPEAEETSPLSSELEEISALLLSKTEESSTFLPLEAEDRSGPSPSEVEKSSALLPLEIEESSAPLRSEMQESLASSSLKMEEGSPPSPTKVEVSLEVQHTDVEETSALSPLEIEEGSPLSPTKVEVSLEVQHTDVEETSAPSPLEIEGGSPLSPTKVEVSSEVQHTDMEETSAPSPLEIEEGSPPSPTKVEVSLEVQHTDVDETSAPSPLEIEEGSPPSPTKVEVSSEVQHTNVEETSAPSPLEIEGGSPPSPTKVEMSSEVQHTDVEENSAPSFLEMEGGSQQSPTKVEVSSAVQPTNVENSSAQSTPNVAETLVPSLPVVEETSVPPSPDAEESLVPPPPGAEESLLLPPPDAEECSVPPPPDAEDSSVPPPPDPEDSSVPPPPDLENSSVSPPPDAEESLGLSPPDAEDSSMPPPPDAEESSVPSPPDAEDSSVPSPPDAEDSSVPSPPDAEDSSVPPPPDAEDSSVPPPPDAEESLVPSPPGAEDSLVPPPPDAEDSSVPPPPDAEETFGLSPPDAEESLVPSPPDAEESSVPPPPDAEESSVSSPSGAEESSMPSPPDAEESLMPPPPDAEESSVPPPSDAEESSVPPPSDMEESPATLLSEVDESLSPSKLEESLPVWKGVEETLVAASFEVEESLALLPSEVNESSAPSSSKAEETSVMSPPNVNETSAVSPSELKDSSALFPSEEDDAALHSQIEETSAPLIPETDTEVRSPSALAEKALDEVVDTIVSDKEIPEEKDQVPVETEGKSKSKLIKKEKTVVEEEVDIPLEVLKQEELDIPSEPVDEDDLDDEPLDNNDSSYLKMEELAEREADSCDESALVIDEGDPPPSAEMDEHPALLKTEALKRSLGSEVSIKLVPAKGASERRRKPRKVQSVSIIPKENLLNTSEDLQRRLKAQSLVQSTAIASALAKAPRKTSRHSLKAPIPDLTPLQTDSAKTTTKAVGKSAKLAGLLKKSEQNIKSLLKGPSATGSPANWPQKGKGATRGTDDFRPFPSLPKDTVVIPTYYVSEQEKAQQRPSQPINLSTSNDMPIISKSIPASQPLPANVVPSQRGKVLPLTTAAPRAPTKNVLPPSGTAPMPLPIQSMMPKMDNNMFPSMWSLFGPQLLSSQFLAAAAGASGTLPPFPMDPQKRNLLGAMLAASSTMPRLPMPSEINVYNTALMQMQAQMDALMQPKLPEPLLNVPLPPDLNRYNAAFIQMQAQMDAFMPQMPMPPNALQMPLARGPPVPPSVPPPVPPPVPPFAKAAPTPQVKPQATIHPQPKVSPKPGVQLSTPAQSVVDGSTAQPAVPRKPGGRNMKFTPGSSPRLVKRPVSAAATAVAAGLKIPVPAVNATSRLQAASPAKPSSPVPAATKTPAAMAAPTGTSAPTSLKKFKVGSKLNSVVDKLLAGAGKQGTAVDLSCTAPPMKSSSPVPPRKDTPPLKDATPVKKVIQVTNALTIELENRNDSRDRRVRPPLPALLPCKLPEHPSSPCELILMEDAKRSVLSVSRGVPLNGCVSDVVGDRAGTPPHVVLTPEQARKTLEGKNPMAVTLELLSREAPLTEDDPMSVTCSLPLDKVSVMLDNAKMSPAPKCSGLPTLPPTLAAGGLEILPMEIANTATSTPKQGAPETPIGLNSISLGSNVSLTLTPTSALQEGRIELEKVEVPLEELSAVEPCSPGEDDPAMEPTPSPPQLEPVSSPLKRPSCIHDGEMLSPDKEVPSLDLEVPEGLESSRATQPADASPAEEVSATSKTLAARKKFSFTVNSSFTMTLSDGQKLFTCDICSGVYQRAFSLKRHYLRSHINYIHLQERDISNCGIIVGNKMAVQTEPNTKVCLKDSKITVVSTDEESQEATNVASKEDDNELNLPGLYRCYTCGVCFDLKEQLRIHLGEHRPSSKPDSQEEEGFASKENVFSCEICAYPFRHKKNYLRHVEVCSKRKQPTDQSEWLCLFCNKTFSSAAVRSRHLSCMHRRLRPGLKKSRRSKVQKHTCMYCGTSGPKFNDLNSLLKHMCTAHDDVYFGCLLCEDRYPSKNALQEHSNATHQDDSEVTVEAPQSPDAPDAPDAPAAPEDPVAPSPEPEQEVTLAEPTKGKTKQNDAFQFVCTVCKKMFVNEMNMNRHKQLAHGGPRGKKKRRAGNATRPPTPPALPDTAPRRKEAENRMDPEALFYSRLSTQIRENLMHHLDGKLDSQEVFERQEEEPLVVKPEVVPVPPPNPTTSAHQEESTLNPHKVKNIPRRRSSESYLRLTWDKYNINKDKNSRNSVSSFIRDMSHIDIPTQLIMRRNMKRLSEKDATKCSSRSSDDQHRLEYPSCIALTRSAEGSRSLESTAPESLVSSMLSVTAPVVNEEPSTSTALEHPSKTSLNPAEDFLNGPWKNRDLSNEEVELSGEWVRPKRYLCAACDAAFLDNLYEMEDHQYLMHPNVWGTYWEFEESTLLPFRAAGIASPSSLYQRSLKPTGSLISAPPHPASQTKDIACTKCSRLNHTVPELHRHMLDCGGDTTWHLTMVLSSPVNGRRNRKWRPFGSRRRRQQGRRGLKRNIPNTPQRPKTNHPKTRGGDAETIQRMIANLPAKRSTRRVIQFKEDEVKTRSQATIASTRLLRKRFKVPFPVSQSPLHKASRALLGRSMASSSSKPGHMPKARPLRSSSSSSAAAALAAAAATARKASKVQSPPKAQPEPQEVAHTLVQVQTLIPAKVKKFAKSGDKLGKLVIAKSFPNPSMEAIPSTSQISVEDIPESLLDSPGKGENNTDVILEAMRQAMMSANFHLCSVCGRMFNNSANRDRHFRVCAAQAEEGMPRLRKEASAPRSRQPSKISDIPVLSPSTAVNLTPGDSAKVAKSGEEVAEPSTAEPSSTELSSEPSGSGKKKKRTIVGIRKSLVQSEESGGSMVVTKSFLVRVDSSSNEMSENETKDKPEDELSDDVFDKFMSVEVLSPKKDSKKKGARRSKVEPAAESRKKKKTKVVTDEEVPVKKLTRSKQASPQKVPVMRVDRSLNPDVILSGVELPLLVTVGDKSEDLPVEADPDNLDFEELLNTMDAEEIKQLDMIVSETPSSDADDDIPLGEQIPIWKKEAEAQGDLSEDVSTLKPKKGMKRRSADVLPAAKKTRSSSMLAEELVEAIEIEVEEPKKGRASKTPVAAKGKRKSLQDVPTLMLPPSAFPQDPPKALAKSRRRSSVMKVDPPAEIVDVVDEAKPENAPVKGGKKKAKAVAKPAENVPNVNVPSQEPEQVVLSGKKKTKAAKQAESVIESESEEVGELSSVLKNKSKGGKLAEVAMEPESDVVKEAKLTTKRKSKYATKAAEEVVPLEFAVNEEVVPVLKKKSKAGKEEAGKVVVPLEFAVNEEVVPVLKKKSKAGKEAVPLEFPVNEVVPVLKKKSKAGKEAVPLEFSVNEGVVPVLKKKSKAGKSTRNTQPETDLVEEVKPPTKRKSKASKPAENTEELVADLVEEIKPIPKRKSKGAAKLAENVAQPEQEPQLVLDEQVAPVSTSIEPSDAAAVATPVLTPVSTPVPTPVSKKKSRAAARAAENFSQPGFEMSQDVTPAPKRKSKAKSAETITNPDPEATAEDLKPATKKKTKAATKPAGVVIEPDPNLVGELTPRNRKRIQPLEGDGKKAKSKLENPPSPAAVTLDVLTTAPMATKKGKAPEETAPTPKETSPFNEPEKKETQPVKRKQKKRVSNQPTEDTGEKIESLPEDPIPKVNRKRPRSSVEGESTPVPKGRRKKKAKTELQASLDLGAAEEVIQDEATEKPKAPKKKAVVLRSEPEEAPVLVDCAVTPGPADVQSKPKKKSKQSKTNVESLQVDEPLRKDSELSSGVTPLSENEQVKSSECAAAPTTSTPMDPPAANSPTPGEQPDITPKKRKSSIGSQFFCDLCQRHYSTAYNLTKHLSSLSHRALLRGIQTSEIVAASGDGEGKTNKSDVVPKAEESEKTAENAEGDTAVVNQEESNEPFLDIGKDPLKNPTSDVVGSHSSMEDPVVLETTHSEIQVDVQSEITLVQNKELDAVHPTPMEQTPKNSEESVRIAEEQLQERATEEPLQERIAEEPLQERVAEEQIQERVAEEQIHERVAEEQIQERVAEEQIQERVAEEQIQERVAEEQIQERVAEEQIQERVAEEQIQERVAEEQIQERVAEEQIQERIAEDQTQERIAEEQIQERIAEELQELQDAVTTERQSYDSTAVIQQIEERPPAYTPLDSMGEMNPISEETLPVPTPTQASLVQDQNQFQHNYVPPQNSVQEIQQQGYSQEQPYSEQQYNCYENRNWQGGDTGWGPWRIPDSSDDMNSSMGFGLGSILDSVNQVLAGDGGVASDLPDSVYTGYALNEIQNAVGATDEEMAVLRQLGEGSFVELVGTPGSIMWPPTEETQLLDLDNQRPNQPPESEKAPAETVSAPLTSRKSSKSPAPSTSRAPTPSKTPNSVDAIPGTSSRDDTRSPVSMMPRPKTVAAGGNSLNELYEDRQMWCPSCHRRFLGLQAMKAHMAQHHSQNQRVERKATFSAEGSSEHRIICEICREMVVDQVALELHMEELHSGHNDPSKAVPASPSPGAKSRVLRLQMSHALGGLLDRALKNYLSKSSTGAASSVDTDRSRFTLGLLNKLALRHQAANQRESPRSTPNPSENDGDGASSHSGSTTPTNLAPKRRNSRTEPMFVQYQGHPCPHCPEKFMSDAFVKRHINNVHSHLLTPDPTDDNVSDSDSRAASPMEFCADPVIGDDGAFLCSSCGITFKSPSEVLEHQRVQHPQPSPEELARSAAENEECGKPGTPTIRLNDNADPKTDDDLDSAEIAEKVSEFQQRVTNPLKGRSLLTKDLKNKKIALAVESALLEHTAEVQVIAEAALRELGPCRKSSKSSTKESPKWGIDAVKFTVAKEPALIGAFGPVSEQESRLRNIPIVRKTPGSAPRFSFAERKKFPKPSTEVKPVKEKMEIYEFDESPRVEALTLELKREVEDKSVKTEVGNRGETAEKRCSVSEAPTEVEKVQPLKPVEEPLKTEPLQAQESPKTAPAKKRMSVKRKDAPGKGEGNPSKVAKIEKKKIFKKRKSDQGECTKSSEGAKSRAPRTEKDGDSSGRVRKQRRASTHDATDYSVFDFSSDESSAGAAIDVNVETSAASSSPRARRESTSPPKKATPSRVQELMEEDWTWLDDSESEKEKRKKMARRKRTKKKTGESPKKQSAFRDSTADSDALEEAVETTKSPEESSSAAGASKRRKRPEASAVAGSSGESVVTR